MTDNYQVDNSYTLNATTQDTQVFLFRDQMLLKILTPLVTEINIYEDLFSPCIHCYVSINDSLAITEILPIIGDETIIIQFKTPTFASSNRDEKPLVLAFKVVGIPGRQIIKEAQQVIILQAVSFYYYENLFATTDKSYRSLTSTSIAQNIFKEYFTLNKNIIDLTRFYNNKIARKSLEIVESGIGNLTYVAPMVTPFESIIAVGSESGSTDYPLSQFLFWEDHRQFNFKTIGSLFEQEPLDTYVYGQHSIKLDPTNQLIEGQQQFSEFFIIHHLQFDSYFDLITQITNGFYDNTVKLFDPLTARYRESTFVYDKDFSKTTPIDKHKVITNRSRYNSLSGDSHTRYINFYDGRNQYINQRVTEGNDSHTFNRRQRDKHLNYSIHQLASMELIKLKIIVTGDSRRVPGDMINVKIPQTISETNKYNRLLGNQNQAKFLVTACNHNLKIGEGKFFTTLECVKNSFGSSAKEFTL